MPTPILATKLHVPVPRHNAVPRPRLSERLNSGLHRKLTLVSAPAGSGKTTVIGEWLATSGRPAAWLSLDEDHKDPALFLAYLIAAVQTVSPLFGADVSGALRSPQPPAVDAVLAALISDMDEAEPFILVLDDYHAVDAKPVEDVIGLLVEHLPRHVHMVIATRVDPALPLARMRAKDQVTE
ncbi:MAG TPA: AAA family ATPase, partial [Trueperaceae bacterium]|nr:AAA family ATPase [Trueperaceae bacterium]